MPAFAESAVEAWGEVARRLNRELALTSTEIDRRLDQPGGPTGTIGVDIKARDASDDTPGPVVRARIDPSGLLDVVVRCPAGDAWEHAASAVAEMHGELLGALLDDPALGVTEAPALSAETRTAVLGPLAGAAVDHGDYRSVLEQILAAAHRAPEAVAAYAGSETLTYRQLVGHASTLGSRIRAAGVDGGSLVPVLVADGLALPVAWSAAMFAGTGYVPVDPRWPAQRVQDVLDRLDCAVVLCADPAAVPATHRHRALVVDVVEEDTAVAASSGTAAVPVAGVDVPVPGPDDVVYGVYTSGTTGTPLCAVNLHSGLVNRLAFMDRWFGAAPGREVVLQSTRHTFDSAFWQIFWPLTRGGATVVPSVGGQFDLQHTIDLIETHQVTVADFVPAVLHALLALVQQRPATIDRLRSLRHVVIGGEQINPRDAHRLRELLPGLRASNAYGPTEASIGMIFHEVEARDGDDVPLGRPIDNCTALVVDADGRPLPPGATGEIVIGGACVGAGYHGAPDRTAQRFFSSPWPEQPGGAPLGRMYRTGDLGYVDAEGRFRFVGRIDHQIKIAGVRIEPGEIETLALDCPGVRQSVALVAGSATDPELVLVLTGTASADEVLAHLRSRLPRASVPQRCVVVGELPLTEAGKIDRRRLTAQVDLAVTPSDTDTDADGDVDPVLAVLRAVLRRPRLAAADDVFAAGVSSLQAVAAAIELSDRLGADVGVRDMLDQPTAAGLRDLIERRRHAGSGAPASSDLVAADLAMLTDSGGSTASGGGAAPRGRPPQTPRTVLLTGATGFVGTRLLHELLERTDLDVLCLVRGTDDLHARERLLAALAAQRLDHPGLTVRTTVVTGDLALPGLGLTPARWRELAERVDVVVHAGAMVNLVYDYRMHREPNVLGTAELIRLARAAGGVPLHHVSTLGALHDHALLSGGLVREDVDVAGVTPPTSGYSLSKWVAERLVLDAGLAGLPVTVLRLGEVMPATDTAVPNPTALTHLLLTAVRRLGVVPDATIRSDFSPVDEVARFVVATVQDAAALGKALHVYRPGSVRFDALAQGAEAVRPERVPCVRFLADLRSGAARGDAELGMLLAVVEHRADVRHDDVRHDDEAHLRGVLENLLQDNPALFDRSDSARLERRNGLDLTSWSDASDTTPDRPEREPVAAGAGREEHTRA